MHMSGERGEGVGGEERGEGEGERKCYAQSPRHLVFCDRGVSGLFGAKHLCAHTSTLERK